MDTNRDLQLPSGYEVVGASLQPYVPPERSGFRGRLDTLKSRGLARVHDIRRVASERGSSVQTSLRDGTKTRVMRVNESMKTNPMLWAGIAAASGFGIGMIGRIAQWRSKQRRFTPELVIIESSC